MSENTTITKLATRKIKFTHLMNIVLMLILALLVIFGYLYYKQMSVVDVVKQAVPAGDTPGKPNYLFTIYGAPDERLTMPGFTFVEGNRIYVTNTGKSNIMVFDYNGRFLFKFGGQTKYKGSMEQPVGIASYNGRLYITDNKTGRIGIYTVEGEFVDNFAGNSVRRPSSIFYKDNKFYVFDIQDHQVKVIDTAGKLLLSFGGRGIEPGKFKDPVGLNVDKEGNIYVPDSNNFRVQVFTPQGKLKTTWQGKGRDNAEGYTVPRGISFDRQGFAWIANTLAAGVSVTDAGGKRLVIFGEGESENDSMTLPTSTFIDANNRLYITAFGDHRVLVYQIP